MQYFVVMIDYGRRGREAIVDPEITRREVISRVASGEYRNISFIHEIVGAAVDDITADILAKAACPKFRPPKPTSKPVDSIAPATSESMKQADRPSPLLLSYILSGLFCLSMGLTPWLLSGILSLP